MKEPNSIFSNQRFHIPIFIILSLIALGFTLAVVFTKPKSVPPSSNNLEASTTSTGKLGSLKLSQVFHQSSRTEFPILLVADRDKHSKTTEDKGTIWKSVLLRGLLKRNSDTGAYTISYEDKPWEISGLLVEGSRGMELSELKMFDGKLYAVDDRTGIVYQLLINTQNDGQTKVRAVARHILADGDGYSTSKGFKCEWMTVKDNKLYIGSIGKEWTNGKGEILSQDPMYVKTIDANGRVEHLRWVENFKAMLKAVGITGQGYMVHEAGEWSDYHQRWFFLPRRVSFESYDEKEDEQRGSNYIISASEDFSDISFMRIGDIISPARGFSSFKLIPGRPTEVVAIKSEETDEAIRSFIMVFDIATGKLLLPETPIIEEKIEGMEIA